MWVSVPKWRSHVTERRIDKILRPILQSLYHPVLHFRCDSLLFCLCKSCATEHNADGECAHETVA